MEVASIEAIPVEVGVRPLDDGGIAPYRGKHGAVENVERVLLRLETTTGIEGWGEIRPSPSVDSALAVLKSDIIPEAVGRPLWAIEAFRNAFHYEYLDVNGYVAGVEMAMWDALGHELGVPLHQLLGGRIDEAVPIAATLGILSPERSREFARRALEAGYDVLKVKAGRNWKQDVDRVLAMDNEVDGDLEFRVDPNQGWTFEDAVRVGAWLEDAGVYLQYFEQPIRVDSIGTYRSLRSRLHTPIGINEDTYHRRNLTQLLHADAIDVAVVDLVPAGGILALKAQAAVADEYGISLAHHDGFDLGVKKAAVLHSVATTPAINLAVDTVYPHWEEYLLKAPLTVSEGTMVVPDGPGLGVSVDPAQLDRLRID
ncbi:mandelate racemase/muconate lactonizing enzyme family protein [Halobaculum magnesiiphilum]|uniref:glucarate dehydratase n=1 Tax=Halobaculum magnesiiphilum TaxID=1017351 RepID=A0A8T8WIV6_9EURY|nr:mandelate racemase/muconate lactonizing enzyme family protein [Halobaculum magnesiiphilum]QZP39768.1 mandelate racemase/muconate lactonizing enzyme family protein [Halobaculum magnesiiphilum]